jgi:hypothetical protein
MRHSRMLRACVCIAQCAEAANLGEDMWDSAWIMPKQYLMVDEEREQEHLAKQEAASQKATEEAAKKRGAGQGGAAAVTAKTAAAGGKPGDPGIWQALRRRVSLLIRSISSSQECCNELHHHHHTVSMLYVRSVVGVPTTVRRPSRAPQQTCMSQIFRTIGRKAQSKFWENGSPRSVAHVRI